MSGEEIVISGMSGVFPNSDSVLEFGENLYNKVDMVSNGRRWISKDSEVPTHLGKISNIDKFDAQFFKVGYQQAKVLEPISRKILEHAYGAIFDSGNTQATLKGTKIGVFIGSTFADHSTLCFYDIEHPSDFVVGGSSKSMLANRISYWVDGTGPSYCLDFSCASSAAALEKAFNSIKHGDCDAAVVGSANIISHPMLSLNLRKAGFLCLDGKTKCFDKHGDGYVRSDAASLLFLEKARNAKRIYAEIYHVKGIYDLKNYAPFLPVRNSEDIQKFLTDVYSEIDIEPEKVDYVEANGAAIAEADANELDAIGKVFARDKTVNIGCVKSNMGHSEPVSGLTAVTKLCIAYHKGEIPANLHYNERLDIPAVRDGKVQVLSEHAKFNRGYAAVNNFSYTGANYHIVMKGHFKEKNLDRYKCQIPRIVLASGREESCVSNIFDSLRKKPIDVEEIGLLHKIFEKDILGHTGRGYTILDTNVQGETTAVSESIDYYSGIRRPLWFVFSGMGSQWTGMGADLMRIPTFARAIERCHKVLDPKGVDIVKIISEPDKTIFDNILNAFVGIGAVQIGLTDILKEMGVDPDYIIGHSLGEMACAYHDDTFTAEELILATYCRGKAVLESNLVKGSMAAVGLGYKALVNQCPPEIDVGCHNSSESSTISGPAEVMEEFVEELSKRGIFARKVPSANIAYHSRYVADAGPALLRSLREVIKEPKLRSKKWISTSVPKEHWNKETAKYSSPEYHANNLLSPVLFEEMISFIPSNAVVVEIAPHGLLQAILKRSHPECTHIPLTRRGCPDGVQFLLDGIGKLYEAGYNPKVDILYPKVEFPVSTETPLLSHLVKWEHSETWPVFKTDSGDKITASSRDLIISVHDDDYSYIADHVINGVTTIPEAALLVYVWETLAMHKGVDFRNMSVIFNNVEFHSEVIVKPEIAVKLSIILSKGNDSFEISQDDTLLVSGAISRAKVVKYHHFIDPPEDDFDDIRLNFEDIYKIFSMRGYCYKGALKTIYSINLNKHNGTVKWTNDWILFLDSLIQLNTLTRIYNGVSKVKFIRKLGINVLEQENSKTLLSDEGMSCHIAQINTILGITRCAGVEIDNITYVDKPNVSRKPELRHRSFFPYFATEEIDMNTALEVNIQVVAENANSKYINIIRPTALNHTEVFKNVQNIIDHLPDVNMIIKSINLDTDNVQKLNADQTNVMVVENLLGNLKKIKKYHILASADDYILAIESQVPNHNEIKEYFTVLTCMSNGEQIMILLRKINDTKINTFCYPVTMEHTFSWILRVSGELMTTQKVVLISERQPYSGILGYVKKMKRDGYKNVALVSIIDFHAQPFDYTNVFYKNQIEKDLCVNVLKKGQFGGYYYTSCNKIVNSRNFTLKNNSTGDKDKLSWVETPPCLASNDLIQVSFAGLSSMDCQKATYDFNIDNDLFGMDFSGIDKDGDRVMGIIPGGAMSSTIEADPDLLWPVPDHWSLEDAATVPLPYVQAYYCLILKGQIKRGQRILITGGAGALGQAVISLCNAFGCVAFTTVSEMVKKKNLMTLFPELNENHICLSECDSLHTIIMTNTKTIGCDLVINCATGSLRETAMKCVGFKGYFLDLSNIDMLNNKAIGMSYLTNDRSYNAVDLSTIFRPEFASNKVILQRYLIDGVAKGAVKPLTRVVYTPAMVSRAFRFLSTRRHIGRVLIRLRDPMIMSQGLKVIPCLTYGPQDVVVVVCDDNCLGIELADKIVERGAKNIVIHMKSALIRGYEHTKFISWTKREVSVKLCSENLHTEQDCAILMKNAMKFGKVKEVFIVQDGKRDDNGDRDEFINIYNNKCSIVMNLDVASRICSELRHFTIVAHSIQSATDEYALSLSERVCELRNEMGLPALVIRCESLAELNKSEISHNKIEPQPLSTLFSALETSLKMKCKNVFTFNTRKENSPNLLQKVAAVLGKPNIKDLENDTTLQDLNTNETSLNELRATIKNTYHIDYPIQKIRRMTIQSLRDLIKNDCRRSTDFDCGTAAFYKEISKEEDYLSQQPTVSMSTLLNNDENSIDPESPYIIMIPGFEGRPEILNGIAERLKIQAVGIQLGPDMVGDSIREMAEGIRKIIKFDMRSKFYILGYSFGVNIALELAAILEEEGQTGIVYCLDSSPDALRIHIDAYLGNLSEGNLQNTLLCHIMNLLIRESTENISHYLENLDIFEEKVEMCMRKLKNVSFSKQYKKYVLESAFKRMKIAKEYNPEITLKSELILMKGIAHPKADLMDDYNLSKYSEKPIKIFNIETDHGLAHQDCRVSNIVNKFLDKHIIEDFKKKSLCNVYYTHRKN